MTQKECRRCERSLKKKTGELRLLEEELQRRGEAGGED